MTVDYATADGTATAPADYTATLGHADVHARADDARRSPCRSSATRSTRRTRPSRSTSRAPTNATIADGQGSGTITDDDPPPDAVDQQRDGDRGQQRHGQRDLHRHPRPGERLRRSRSTTRPPTARRRRRPTTRPPTGHADVRGRPDDQDRRRSPVNGDTLDEANETFFVNLSSPTNATIADGQGVGTITDDDPPPSLTINDVSVTEGNTGTVVATSPSRLSAASAGARSPSTTPRPTARPPRQATTRRRAGTLTFTPGQTTKTVTVLGQRRHARRGRRDVLRQPLGRANATIADAQGVGTIIDDDAPPTLAINNVTVTEGNTGTVNATFTVPSRPRAARP